MLINRILQLIRTQRQKCHFAFAYKINEGGH